MAKESSKTQRSQRQHVQSKGWFIFNRFAKPYYIIHVLLVLSYYPIRMKYLDPILLEVTDWLGYSKEGSIIFMLLVSIGLKWRRSSTLEEFFNYAFLFFKVGYLALVGLTGSRVVFAWFTIIFFLLSLTLEQPEYKGPQKVINLTGAEWTTKIENDRSDVFWVIEFYTTWASSCTQFASLFAEMSLQYTSPGLKFGKIDVGYYDTIAEKYGVSLNHWSTAELPTLMLFRNGEWVDPYRLPPRKQDGTVSKCTLNMSNVNSIFYLDHLTNHRPQSQAKENRTGGTGYKPSSRAKKKNKRS